MTVIRYENSWWPPRHREFADDRWPEEIDNVETIEVFTQFFQSFSFVECPDGEWEEGFEKIALYAVGVIPVHVAKQWSKDAWRSKLGPGNEDVEHTLAALAAGAYGNVVRYFKRKTP